MLHMWGIVNSPHMMTTPWRTHMRVKYTAPKLKNIHQTKKNISKDNTNQKMNIGICWKKLNEMSINVFWISFIEIYLHKM